MNFILSLLIRKILNLYLPMCLIIKTIKMTLIQISDLEKFIFNVNPAQITRVEEYSQYIVIYFSDGFGLKSNLSLAQLLHLIQG